MRSVAYSGTTTQYDLLGDCGSEMTELMRRLVKNLEQLQKEKKQQQKRMIPYNIGSY